MLGKIANGNTDTVAVKKFHKKLSKWLASVDGAYMTYEVNVYRPKDLIKNLQQNVEVYIAYQRLSNGDKCVRPFSIEVDCYEDCLKPCSTQREAYVRLEMLSYAIVGLDLDPNKGPDYSDAFIGPDYDRDFELLRKMDYE